MKKRITLMTMIIAISGLSLYAQILPNTFWKVNDNSNSFFLFFHFGDDTLSYSLDSISYTNASVYQEDGNNFIIKDLTDENCSLSDTGRYTFSIENDTLKFTLINDLCESRIITISVYYWIKIAPSGINSADLYTVIEIYPNPASDMISIKTINDIADLTYIIYDHGGSQVLTGKLTREITSVNIKQLPAGLYFLQIGENCRRSVKIVKK